MAFEAKSEKVFNLRAASKVADVAVVICFGEAAATAAVTEDM